MALDTMPRSCVRRALHRLKDLDLIEATWIEDYGYESVILTRNGKDYLIENPKLLNPVDWKWVVGTTIGFATLAVAILALFIACSKLK